MYQEVISYKAGGRRGKSERDTFLLLNDPAACALIDIKNDGNIYHNGHSSPLF